MSQLMISLDERMLDSASPAALRMIDYGKKEKLFILIPTIRSGVIHLSENVMVHGTGGSKMTQFFRLIRLGKEIILRHSDITTITTQDPFFTALAGWFMRKPGVALEVQVHGDFFGSMYYRQGSLANRLRYILGIFFIRTANRVRVVGERVKQSVKAHGVEEERITVRPVRLSSEATPHFTPRFRLHDRYPGYEAIFVALGRLDPVKNICWLITLFKEVVVSRPRHLLLVVGDGPEKSALQNLAKELALERNVVFIDWTNDPLSFLASADAVLFPSLSEGYGLVAVEAAAMQRPIIMTDVGVANYELKSSDRVHIVPVGDPVAFKNAILHLL